VAILLVVALVGGCAKGTPSATTSGGENLEFVFPGGEVKSGRLKLAPNTQYSFGKTGSTVVLRMADRPGFVEIDCSCFIEGGGICFPFQLPDPDGRIIFGCGYTQECAGQTMDFCVMTITDPEGFQLKFRSPATHLSDSKR
jgi:hypothetical protein